MRLGSNTLSETPADALRPDEIEEVWRFTSRFVQRSRRLFDDMIRTRDVVYRLRDRGGTLRAFAALKGVIVEVEGRRARVIFTSMVCVDPSHRSTGTIYLMALRCLLQERVRHRGMPLFGAAAASSVVSYLGIARASREFWPHPERATPPFEAAVLDRAMRALTALVPARRWVAERGVIEVSEPEVFAEGLVHPDDPARHHNPLIAFYARRNPGQARGDSLAVLVPVTARNLFTQVAHIARKSLRRMLRTVTRRRRPA